MDTTVELQNPIEYSLWVNFLAAFFIVAAIALFAFIIIRAIFINKKKVVERPVIINEPISMNMIEARKNGYIQLVRDIKNRYEEGTVSKRNGYQELSGVIRQFIHEVTGINVENLTAAEIKAIGMRELDALMQEYYVPEFAEDERAEKRNLSGACDRAEGVIRSWS